MSLGSSVWGSADRSIVTVFVAALYDIATRGSSVILTCEGVPSWPWALFARITTKLLLLTVVGSIGSLKVILIVRPR